MVFSFFFVTKIPLHLNCDGRCKCIGVVNAVWDPVECGGVCDSDCSGGCGWCRWDLKVKIMIRMDEFNLQEIAWVCDMFYNYL